MNKTTPLTDLANFVGRSQVSSEQQEHFWQAYGLAAERTMRRPVAAKVTDLLGMVTTLSARTRRIAAPVTITELDVFSPNGNRAVHLIMGEE